MTLLKAGYIVLVFMHLGDEKKSLKYIVLVPYFLFMAYLIFIALMEATAVGNAWETYGG
jgi:cytochrome c oxidase subunit IV